MNVKPRTERSRPSRSKHQKEMSQLLYSVPEVASVLSLSERLIWKLVRTGDIKSFKIGAARRVERKAIDDYLSIMR